MADLTPYSTAKALMGPLPSWLTGEDAERISAYAVYESIYKNVPEAFKLVQRGTDSKPIYLPNARTLIEAKNRYLAKRWNYSVRADVGSDADRAALKLQLDQLFARERLTAKFATQKRYGLIRGDAVWHIRADAAKEVGTRISVDEVDPGSYFPVLDPWNPERRLGCHLVDQVEARSGGGKVIIKRQTYRKTDTGRITYELTWWEQGGWDDREGGDLKPAASADIPDGDENDPVPAYELDPRITSLPVYLIKNNRTPGDPFGSSDLQGFELLLASVNQAISDQDLRLILEGLGVYVTNSGPPVDDQGVEQDWVIGPGYVLEVDDEAEFKRISGITTITPSLDHIAKMEGSMREASGVPDIAVGKVDTQVAESGVALAFHMAPLLSANEEKQDEILSVMDQLLHDLVTMWLPVFEAFTTEARAVSQVGDPMPVNRKAVLEEVLMLLSTDPPLVDSDWARQYLTEKLGYTFTDGMLTAVVGEAGQLAGARNVDPFATRVQQELEGE